MTAEIKKILYSGEIVKGSGPSLHDLLASLSVVCKVNSRMVIPVSFGISPSIDEKGSLLQAVHVVIRGMEHTGNYEDWKIKARLSDGCAVAYAQALGGGVSGANLILFGWSGDHTPYVRVEYSTRTRTGQLEIVQ